MRKRRRKRFPLRVFIAVVTVSLPPSLLVLSPRSGTFGRVIFLPNYTSRDNGVFGWAPSQKRTKRGTEKGTRDGCQPPVLVFLVLTRFGWGGLGRETTPDDHAGGNGGADKEIRLRCCSCGAAGFFRSSSSPQLLMTMGTFGRSFSSVGMSTIFAMTSSYPRITRPNTTCLPAGGRRINRTSWRTGDPRILARQRDL